MAGPPSWIIEWLADNGYRAEAATGLNITSSIDSPLGCGSYGCVYQTSDPRWVLKITDDPDEGPLMASIIALRKKHGGGTGYGPNVHLPGIVFVRDLYQAFWDELEPIYVIVREEVNPWQRKDWHKMVYYDAERVEVDGEKELLYAEPIPAPEGVLGLTSMTIVQEYAKKFNRVESAQAKEAALLKYVEWLEIARKELPLVADAMLELFDNEIVLEDVHEANLGYARVNWGPQFRQPRRTIIHDVGMSETPFRTRFRRLNPVGDASFGIGRYKWMPLDQVLAWEPIAAELGVSKIARSKDGFTRAYEAAAIPEDLSPHWLDKRERFIARHVAQAKANGESWFNGEMPTRRHLALIMWGYSPEPRKLPRPGNRGRELRANPIAQPILRSQVAKILAAHPGNTQYTESQLADRWVKSERFRPMSVHAWLPDLGVTPGKPGRSVTVGPIIVDENIQGIGRYPDTPGPAPEFAVLDGQNRVVSARRIGPCAVVDALVGDAVFERVARLEDRFAEQCAEIEQTIQSYLTDASPGGSLEKLRIFVRRGLLSEDRLLYLRARRKHGRPYTDNPVNELRPNPVPSPQEIEFYSEGACELLASALAKRLGYTPVAMRYYFPDGSWTTPHVFAVAGDVAVDAGGPTTVEEIVSRQWHLPPGAAADPQLVKLTPNAALDELRHWPQEELQEALDFVDRNADFYRAHKSNPVSDAPDWLRFAIERAEPRIVELHGREMLPESWDMFGCGGFGCVLPTRKPGWICKVSIEGSEAFFARAQAKLDLYLPGVCRYLEPIEVETGKGPVWIMWRQAIEGETFHDWREKRRTPPDIEAKIDEAMFSEDTGSAYMRKLKAAERLKAEWRREQGTDAFEILKELQQQGLRVAATFSWFSEHVDDRPYVFAKMLADRAESAKAIFKPSYDLLYWHYTSKEIPRDDHVLDAAVGLLGYRYHLGQLQGHKLMGALAAALTSYLDKGLLLADPQPDNIAMVNGVWTLFDCGFTVPISTRWNAMWLDVEPQVDRWFGNKRWELWNELRKVSGSPGYLPNPLCR